MTPRAAAREIIDHHKAKGLVGLSLKWRLLKHASILWGQDREVARELFRSADMR